MFMWSIVGMTAVKRSPKAPKAHAATKARGNVRGSQARSRLTRPAAVNAESTRATIAT